MKYITIVILSLLFLLITPALAVQNLEKINKDDKWLYKKDSENFNETVLDVFVHNTIAVSEIQTDRLSGLDYSFTYESENISLSVSLTEHPGNNLIVTQLGAIPLYSNGLFDVIISFTYKPLNITFNVNSQNVTSLNDVNNNPSSILIDDEPAIYQNRITIEGIEIDLEYLMSNTANSPNEFISQIENKLVTINQDFNGTNLLFSHYDLTSKNERIYFFQHGNYIEDVYKSPLQLSQSSNVESWKFTYADGIKTPSVIEQYEPNALGLNLNQENQLVKYELFQESETVETSSILSTSSPSPLLITPLLFSIIGIIVLKKRQSLLN